MLVMYLQYGVDNSALMSLLSHTDTKKLIGFT